MPEHLAPAPWQARHCEDHSCWHVVDAAGNLLFAVPSKFLAERIALWRNAEDVMERRGWWSVPRGATVGWSVRLPERDHTVEDWTYPGPFTALVEADRWMKENAEAPHA